MTSPTASVDQRRPFDCNFKVSSALLQSRLMESKMDASYEAARERSCALIPRSSQNAVLDRQFSPQPSPPYKNPTNT
jgi:hypothetical protein